MTVEKKKPLREGRHCRRAEKPNHDPRMASPGQGSLLIDWVILLRAGSEFLAGVSSFLQRRITWLSTTHTFQCFNPAGYHWRSHIQIRILVNRFQVMKRVVWSTCVYLWLNLEDDAAPTADLTWPLVCHDVPIAFNKGERLPALDFKVMEDLACWSA